MGHVIDRRKAVECWKMSALKGAAAFCKKAFCAKNPVN